MQNNFIRAIQIKSLYNIHKRNNSDEISFVHTHTHTRTHARTHTHYSFFHCPYYTHNICILYNTAYNTAIVPLMVIKNSWYNNMIKYNFMLEKAIRRMNNIYIKRISNLIIILFSYERRYGKRYKSLGVT